MRAEIGPYAVVGYFHTLPTADPLAIARRRRVVALRPVRLAFEVAGEPIEETHDALLLMSAKITSFESASDESVGLSRALEAWMRRDGRAQDVTGEGSVA